MTRKTQKWRMLLASSNWPMLPASTTWAALAVSGARAHDDALRHSAAPATGWSALAPVEPPVMPHADSEGTYGLRMRLRYFDTLTGNVELRRHQYFLDDNVKTLHPRTSITWSLRLRF